MTAVTMLFIFMFDSFRNLLLNHEVRHRCAEDSGRQPGVDEPFP